MITRTSGIDKTVEQLVREGTELKATWDEVERSVAAAERQQWVPRPEVKRWVERADGLLQDLDEFQGRYWSWKDQFHGLFGFLLTCGCPLLCGYALGASAADLLVQVQELNGQKIDLEEVARPPRFRAVEKIPASTFPLIGYQGILSEIWHCLRDDRVGVIGICGVGLIANFTILTTVNNDANALLGTQGSCFGFDIVVWVDMPKDMTVEKLLRRMAKRCCLAQPRKGGGDDDSISPQLLFKFLTSKRFLLLLNDMWRPFDLAEVGVPLPGPTNKSKIVFTTRSDHVCHDMEVDRRILVDLLNQQVSWELFRTRVPAELLDSPSIRKHAEALLAACDGLPLALVRVGRTMASKKKPLAWESASRKIVESPLEVRGMDDVINMLTESFDNLSSDLARRCLIHCSSAFRDRGTIDVEELVDSMITGGLLGEEGRAKGYDVVEDLKALFLLQPCGDGSNPQVKLPNPVRIMALHVAKRLGGANA